ncbi:MAG: carbohydrate ABC transporter permease [Thermomicrobiales bacterium]|nr:carbohydrate ABC transporter permease [Thermomicrobiales bacterium]
MSHKLRSTLGHLLLHIVLLSLGVIFLLPFVWSVSTSLKPMSDLFQVTPNLIPSQIRWQNYQDVLDYVPFARIYANTIFVTVLRVIGQVFLASLAAFAFSRMQFPGRDFLFFLLLAGLMVPQQVLMIPNYAMMRQVGWLDSYQGLVVPLLFSSFGVFLLRQYFLSIPADFQEAATLEGANPFQIYWQIYLPLARPALAAFAFLVIQWSWNEFLWALIMTSRTEMQVLSVGVALFQGQYFTNNALLMAAANMATIPVLLLFLFFQRQLVEGITLSGLK